MQMLFLWDQSREAPEKVVAGYWGNLVSEEMPGEEPARRKPIDEFANQLLFGAVNRSEEADSLIRAHAENWRLERMSGVDRNILRLAIFELLERQTPAPVVIDEALEVARRFSGDESVQFINGVLDAVHKSLPVAEVTDDGEAR